MIDEASASSGPGALCPFVTDEAGLNAAKPGGRLLGLFADGNMPQEWTGPAAKVGGTDPARCTPNGSFGGPHLSTMASRAIGLLDAQTRHSRKGFFLQIEGASMDKRDHSADPCGQIGETAEFDKAVQASLDYARRHPDTLVVVTADHGHPHVTGLPLPITPPRVAVRASRGRRSPSPIWRVFVRRRRREGRRYAVSGRGVRR
ncbi:alkaline phosphatase [Actinomadura verrucosospora]